MNRLVLIGLLLLLSRALHGQTRLSGVVRDRENQKSLAGLSVTVQETPTGKILSFGITNGSGAYSLSFESSQDSVFLNVSGLSIQKYIKKLANRSTTLDISVTLEAIKLKEVKVKPPRVRRLNDTINYAVDGFIDKNDRTIGDVLKKMPGISVNESGQILYNNRPINKFYIEDKDLLQGRYGIATNNLEAKDVAAVQVLENHQPVKILKDREFSQDAAVNLKLKDSAKGVLTANGQLGAGIYPFLWDNELTTMSFNRQSQLMATYKGNNSGRNVTLEHSWLYPGQSSGRSNSLLAVQSPSTPGISPRRYFFNNSHIASLNKLWSKAKDQQTTLAISYLRDRTEKNSYARSEYYRPGDSPLLVEEQVANVARTNELEASLDINRNKDRYFLESTTRFKGSWNEELGLVYNEAVTRQDLQVPSYALSHSVKLIRNLSKGQFTLNSTNQFVRAPHRLLVSPPVAAPPFDSLALSELRQEVERRDFSSKNSVSLSLGKGRFQQNYSLFFSANLQHLESNLTGRMLDRAFQSLADSLKNNLSWNRFNLGANPSWTLRQGPFKGTLTLSLDYFWLNATGLQGADDKNFSQLFFNPSFLMQYEISQYLNLAASAQLNTETAGIERGFDGYILGTYRSLQRNEGNVPRFRDQAYRIDLNYRDPIHALFGTLGVRYNRNRRNLLYAYDYLGILTLSRAFDIPNVTASQSLMLNVNKGIDALNAKLSLNGSYNRTEAIQFTAGTITPFQSRQYQVSPGFNTRIKSWASLNYQFRYSQSSYEVEGQVAEARPVRNSAQEIQLSLFPAKGLIVTMGHEFFYSNAILVGSRRMNFADATLRYKHKKYELIAEYTNIFNTRRYVSATNDRINTFYYSYELRPAQLLLKVRFKIK